MTLGQLAQEMRDRQYTRVQPKTKEKQEKLNKAFYKYPVVMYNKIKDDLREKIITYREMAVLQEIIFRIIQYKDGRESLQKEIAATTFDCLDIVPTNVSMMIRKFEKIGYISAIMKSGKKGGPGKGKGSIYKLNLSYFGISSLP